MIRKCGQIQYQKGYSAISPASGYAETFSPPNVSSASIVMSDWTVSSTALIRSKIQALEPQKKSWAELLNISWDATRRMRNPARVQDSYLAHPGALGELGIQLAGPLIVQEERATLGTRLFCADLHDGAEQFVEFLDACYFPCDSEQQSHLLDLFAFIGED